MRYPAKWGVNQKEGAKMEKLIDTQVKWDNSGLALKMAVCDILGWRTHTGKITRTGIRIATSKWNELTTSAREVLTRHGVTQ
jgi:hypothetical protein